MAGMCATITGLVATCTGDTTHTLCEASEFRSSLIWDVTQRGFVVITDVSGQPIGLIFKVQVVLLGLLEP